AFRPGDRLLLTAFGGGITWGSCLLTWPSLPRPERGLRPTVLPVFAGIRGYIWFGRLPALRLW
ncbi:3-oxoacyl-[acyl-carrier-protein] synthase III C-terminal domain-containing protein, partial [Streptomyces avermitilis]|uniref:3-oxoacyl-[acyl-carrier-protein] synthase III C-terminal domain-containing protein n=1 Tax=Streptomyces avermitilis TaxID=33903 RepID=UPI0033B8C8CD